MGTTSFERAGPDAFRWGSLHPIGPVVGPEPPMIAGYMTQHVEHSPLTRALTPSVIVALMATTALCPDLHRLSIAYPQPSRTRANPTPKSNGTGKKTSITTP